jgi:hypothetical protein
VSERTIIPHLRFGLPLNQQAASSDGQNEHQALVLPQCPMELTARLFSTQIVQIAFLILFVTQGNARSQDKEEQVGTDSNRLAQKADFLVKSGKVLRADGSFDQAIAVCKNRIVWTGDDRDVGPWMGADTRVLDADGATVTPGFNDAHVHFISGSMALQQVQLLAATNLDEIKYAISSYVKDHPNVETVVGRGWLYGAFPDGLPTCQILDVLVPDRPALMRSYDGHTVWVNSFVLRKAGIDRNATDPTGGVIVRDLTTGEPTGVLKESAQRCGITIHPTGTRTRDYKYSRGWYGCGRSRHL